jgi:NNP family nitrate/nitrite transporter-like MFS transporter
MFRAQRISNWDPEDVAAWQAGNKKIARRNLVWSLFAMHVGYSVWTIWSVLVLFMPQSVYGLSPADKLLLGATATLVGGCLRIPYAVAVAKFGGRNWMVFSSLVLLIPTIGTIALLANPGQPMWMYLVCAALTGMGGGNFSAAAAHVNVFYPQRLKGAALGIAGGGGNIGVPVIQIVGLVVLANAGSRQPYWVCAIYLVLLSLVALGGALFLDNVELPRGEDKPMRAALAQRDTWILATLYIATYGSFIGFRSPSARSCRWTTWPQGKVLWRRRCMPPKSLSWDRYSRRWPGCMVAGWPTASAAVPSPCEFCLP